MKAKLLGHFESQPNFCQTLESCKSAVVLPHRKRSKMTWSVKNSKFYVRTLFKSHRVPETRPLKRHWAEREERGRGLNASLPPGSWISGRWWLKIFTRLLLWIQLRFLPHQYDCKSPRGNLNDNWCQHEFTLFKLGRLLRMRSGALALYTYPL